MFEFLFFSLKFRFFPLKNEFRIILMLILCYYWDYFWNKNLKMCYFGESSIIIWEFKS